ncbi:MAG: succinylglutamate desuccinylase/aspartoacylase family protein [Dehalococcoidia bacterium]
MSRRTFLASSTAAALCAACSSGGSGNRQAAVVSGTDLEPPSSPTITPTPTAAPTTTPVPTPTPRPAGSEERTLLAGTPSETRLVVRHSGVIGPVTMVLGGVHGNEPGGWLAADEVATWAPAKGSLITIPRSNVQAIASFVRTFEEIGDLNRLYPGNLESPLLMERMAATILGVCREFEVSLLLDMHESWAFYAEYPPNSGTGALGQTITAGPGPVQSDFAQRMAAIANPQASTREQFIVRDGTQFGRPTATPSASQTTNVRGRSSLSAGGHVPGLTPVLVEMGQTDQPVERRVALHLITARAALSLQGQL